MAMILAAREWSDAVWVIVVCSAMLVAGVAILATAWFYGRRLLKEASSSGDASEPWTLHDLRQLRDRGAISEQEFEAMRAAMIRTYRDKDSATDGEGPGPDN